MSNVQLQLFVMEGMPAQITAEGVLAGIRFRVTAGLVFLLWVVREPSFYGLIFHSSMSLFHRAV